MYSLYTNNLFQFENIPVSTIMLFGQSSIKCTRRLISGLKIIRVLWGNINVQSSLVSVAKHSPARVKSTLESYLNPMSEMTVNAPYVTWNTLCTISFYLLKIFAFTRKECTWIQVQKNNVSNSYTFLTRVKTHFFPTNIEPRVTLMFENRKNKHSTIIYVVRKNWIE